MSDSPYHKGPPSAVALRLEQRGDLFVVADGTGQDVYGPVGKADAEFALKDLREQAIAGTWDGVSPAYVSAQITDPAKRKQQQTAGQASGEARGKWHEFVRDQIPSLRKEFHAAGHQPNRIYRPIAKRILTMAKEDKAASKLKWPKVTQVARFVSEVINPK